MSAPTCLDAALLYAKRGWRVIPVAPGQKRPPFKEWQKLATCDPEMIRRWWTMRPDYGVGIATGSESGLYVVDIDDTDDKAGSKSWAELGVEVETVETITGSGGRHLLFQMGRGDDLPNTSNKLGQYIDTRGEGGFIVAPPTIHPNGQPYRWRPDHRFDQVALAVLPEDLRALLEPEPEPERGFVAAPIELGEVRPGDRWAASVGWDELLAKCGAERHHEDGEGTYWTRPGKDKRDGPSGTVLKRTDLFFNHSGNWPGLEAGKSYTRFGFYTAVWHGGDYRAATQELVRTGFGAPPVRYDDLSAIYIAPGSEKPEEATGEPGADELELLAHFVSWPELWEADSSTHDWLIEPILARGRAHVLYAGAKTGKSLLALPIAAAIASGRSVLGNQLQEAQTVLYLDYEMSADDLRERLESFGYGPADDLTRLKYALIPSFDPLDTERGGQQVVRLAKKLGAVLVVIDTTGRAVEGEENSADTFRALYKHTGMWLKQAGITTLRIDHAGKDSEKGQRGSSAKNDDVDVVYELRRSEAPDHRGKQVLRMKATHRRVSWIPDETILEMISDGEVQRWILPGGTTVPSGTGEAMRLLDELGLAADVGRRKAREALKLAGHKCSDAALNAALRTRKRASEDAMLTISEDIPEGVTTW